MKLEDGVQALYKNEMEPLRVEDACPGRGKHAMFRRGGATLIRVNKDGTRTTLFKGGAAWQCKYCREVIVTQHDPLSGITGYYSMRNPGYIISAIHTTMEASPNAIGYIYNGKPPYCNFYNN